MATSIPALAHVVRPRTGQLLRLALVVATITPVSATAIIARVYTEDGNPVKAASITVQSTTATPAVQGNAVKSGAQYKAVTDDQGKFVLDLPNGQYTVCVRASSKKLLDSCQWFLDENVIEVRAGFAPFKIVLRAGVLMRIRLNDPTGLWPQARGPQQTSTSVGFILYDAQGYSHPIPEVSGDNRGRNFEILVPPNRNDLRLTVRGRSVDVVDQLGSLASRATAMAITSARSDLAQTLVYQVVPLSAVATGFTPDPN